MWYRQRDRRGRREPGGRLESVPTARRPGRAPWHRGSGGAPAGSATVVLRLLRGESLEALSREAGVGDLPARRVAGAGHGWPRARLKRLGTASPWRRCSTRRSGTSGSCRWRSSCSASGRGPRSSASLWRCGGRDDERDDLRGDGALFRHPAGVSGLGALALGALRAAGAGTPPAGRGAGAAGGRRRGNRTRSCWRRFGPISLGPRSTAKAIARSTPGFGSWTGSESPARGCCASCGRTDCSPRTAGVRAPRRPTTGGSSPRRPT